MEAAERPRWTLPGTFTVLPTRYEDEAAWLVIVGGRESLVDGQADLMEWDAPRSSWTRSPAAWSG